MDFLNVFLIGQPCQHAISSGKLVAQLDMPQQIVSKIHWICSLPVKWLNLSAKWRSNMRTSGSASMEIGTENVFSTLIQLNWKPFSVAYCLLVFSILREKVTNNYGLPNMAGAFLVPQWVFQDFKWFWNSSGLMKRDSDQLTKWPHVGIRCGNFLFVNAVRITPCLIIVVIFATFAICLSVLPAASCECVITCTFAATCCHACRELSC